jgi:hypothetical protein
MVDIAMHAYSAIQTASVGGSGAAGALLVYALGELRSLADRSLPGIHPAATKPAPDAPNVGESD